MWRDQGRAGMKGGGREGGREGEEYHVNMIGRLHRYYTIACFASHKRSGKVSINRQMLNKIPL